MENRFIEYMILIAATLTVVWLISFILRKALDFFIQKSSNQISANPTNFIFLKNSISVVCYSIGIFWIFTKIPYLNSLGNALFASAGVLAAVIGFASQKAFANVVGGIFILIFKPFRVGDAIEISSGRKGLVEEITLRHTVIKDYEFKRIVIPNSVISEETIINSSITDTKIRKHIEFAIAYDADIDKAEQIIRHEIEKHPNFIDNRTATDKNENLPAVPIRVVKWGDFSLTLRALVWTKNIEASFQLEWGVLRSIKYAFDSNGIEIPFPYRTIVYKNDITNVQNETPK